VAILAVVLIATLIALLVPPGGEEPIKTPSTTPTQTQPTSTPTNTAVVVDASQIKGKTQAQVEDYLTGLGLRLDPRVGRIAPTVEDQGRAYLVDPEGSVQKNAIIAVTFYADIPTPAKPGPVSVTGGDHQPAGTTATVTWSTYTGCPTGFERTGYQFTVVNATMGTDNPLDPNANSLDLDLPATPGSVSVSYHVICGDLTSPESDVTTITVE
jgi:serine/threonine-protein kinase